MIEDVIKSRYPGIENKKYYQYATNVVAGNIVAGLFIKLACQRFLDNLASDEYYLNEKKIDNAIMFMSILKHYKGPSAGKNFIPEPWQQWIVANIFGLYNAGTNKRKYSRSYIQIARKNGKDFFTVCLALYAMLGDGEASPEVLFGANSVDQANIAFRMALELCKQLDTTNKNIRVMRSEIRVPEIAGFLKVVANEPSKLDGYSPQFAILDEVHEMVDTKMIDVIRSGMGNRLNPHLCMITTAGFNLNGPAYEFRGYCTDILARRKEDTHVFAAIYELDEEDDWTKEENWYKASPNLGISVSLDNMREYVNSAKNNAAEYVNVLTKNLNKWLSSNVKWIDLKYFVDIVKPVDLADYAGQECWIGLDLSTTSDLTALSVMLRPDNEKTIYKVFYYLPRPSIESSKNRQKYEQWEREGYLHVCDTPLVDYNDVLADIFMLNNLLDIRNIYYDRWNSSYVVNECKKKDLPTQVFVQSAGNFNLAMKQFETDVKFQNCIIDKNPINVWCIANTNVETDKHGNIMPNKAKADSYKIDGLCAMLNSLGGKIYDDENGFVGIATS